MFLEQDGADVNPNTEANGNSNDIDDADDRNDNQMNGALWEARVVFCPYTTQRIGSAKLMLPEGMHAKPRARSVIWVYGKALWVRPSQPHVGPQASPFPFLVIKGFDKGLSNTLGFGYPATPQLLVTLFPRKAWGSCQ